MPGTSAQQSLQTVDDFLQHLSKQAEAYTEPGSIGGETSHPVKNVDDNTQKAKEGFRSAENTKDVKEDQGKPSVDSTPEAKAASTISGLAARFALGNGQAKAAEGQGSGSAASDQIQIGTNKQPTGEDPKNETSSAKAGKQDGQYQGKSSHPARTDNDALNGGKYAEDASLEKLANDMKEIGDKLCAQLLVTGYDQTQPKEAQTAPAPAAGATPPAQPKQAAVDDAWLASQVGYELAGLVTGNFDKQAADSLVFNTVKNVYKTAEARADRVIRFLDAHFAAKEAQQTPQPQATQVPPVRKVKQAGEPPPATPAGGGDAAMAAIGGGTPADGPAAGGAPDPAAGGAGGAGGGEEELMQMAQLLKELNIGPQELEQLLMQADGGAGGGAAGAAGGPPSPAGGAGGPPPAPPDMGMGGKAASDKQAQVAKEAANKVANMRDYLVELVKRSQGRRAG